MSNNSNKRSGFPGAGEDHELDADFDAWDKGFDDLVGDEEDGTRVDPKLAGGGEFEFELSFDDDVEGGFTLDDDVDDGFTLDVGEAAEPGPSGAATLDESMPAGSADDAAGGESPTGLGELLGASLELDEIDDAEAFPPPFGGDSGVYDPSAADPVTGAAGSDLEDGEQQVYTSAARPFEATDPAHPGGRMSKVLASFQAVEDEDDDDDFDPFADPEEGASTQITKVVEVDEELLAAAIPDEETDRVKVRRAPTIVRRDDLERLRAEHAARAAAARQEEEDEADDDAFGVQVTKMLSEEQLESLAEEAAPEIEVSVDDDFYDDIEIGESAGGGASSGVPEPAEETESAATPATPTSPGAGRRVSQHVVRRGGSQPTPVVQRPTPVVRPRRRRTRTSQYELSAQLDESRSLDPETTLDLRVMVDGGGEGVSRPGQDENREAEIQAIIDRAAQELRSQGAQPSAGTPPGEAASEDGFEDFEFDWEPDGEATPVPAPVPGAPPVAAFDEVDAIPGLPDPILPAGAITDWPALDPAALAIPAEHVALDAAAKIQDARGLLARFEAALEGPGDDPDTVSLGLAAGWLGEQAGAFERARAHYERALALSPGLLPALRGLRRAERRLGQWDHVIARLEQESERVSAQERRALDQLRAELLIACGERERAAQVSAATAQDAGPDSLRGLMAQVELAIVDGREGDAAAALGQIAEQVGGGRLRCSLRRAQGLMTERAGGDALAAYTAAAADGARTTPLAAARAAHSSAGATPEAAATARATVRAIARAAAETGAGRAPGYEAAMAWRRSLWAERDGDDGRERAVALAEAVRLAPDEALLAAELAAVEAGPGGDHARAVELCLHLGETAATEAARAAALATAAVHLAHLGRDADAARARAQALALDPSYPIAAVGAGTSAGHLDADAVATQVTMDLETLRSDPGAAFERVRAATLFLAQGKGDEAVQLLQAGVAAGASPAVMHQVLDETLVRTGQVHARARLLAGLADDPAATVDPEVLLWRAAEASEAHVAEVLAAHAGDDEADAEHLRLVREGALAGALEAWNRVLDGDPGALAAHLCSIRLAAALGDPDVLDDALERAQAAVREPAQAATLALRRVEVATG
ncbi:hypothetical protein, partial [Haliangium sp.]|uniref:tetratricopeptide repeat protein n=1 Tax=Haliangium sp. TaxID=2663208 RepID=UPI003D0B56B8